MIKSKYPVPLCQFYRDLAKPAPAVFEVTLVMIKRKSQGANAPWLALASHQCLTIIRIVIRDWPCKLGR